MEVLGEPPDRTDVGKCGSLRVITALEFLEHPFAKLGHRDLLVTQTYLLAASDASPCHHAQRPPRERLSSNGVLGNLTILVPFGGFNVRERHFPGTTARVIRRIYGFANRCSAGCGPSLVSYFMSRDVVMQSPAHI